MAGEDRSKPEQIRALIEEVDRVRRESERVNTQVDRAMRRPFWPDRRRSVRGPDPSAPRNRGDE